MIGSISCGRSGDKLWISDLVSFDGGSKPGQIFKNGNPFHVPPLSPDHLFPSVFEFLNRWGRPAMPAEFPPGAVSREMPERGRPA